MQVRLIAPERKKTIVPRKHRLRRREHNGVGLIREDGPDRIEVHVAGACVHFHEDRWRLLAGRRTDQRSLYPGNWECGGGQVRAGETFETALRRQFFEEFGLEVVPVRIIEPYSILLPKGIIPGIRFLCWPRNITVRLDPREFSEYKWLDLPVPDLDWIPGLRETLDRALQPDLLTQEFSPGDLPAEKTRIGFVG